MVSTCCCRTDRRRHTAAPAESAGAPGADRARKDRRPPRRAIGAAHRGPNAVQYVGTCRDIGAATRPAAPRAGRYCGGGTGGQNQIPRNEPAIRDPWCGDRAGRDHHRSRRRRRDRARGGVPADAGRRDGGGPRHRPGGDRPGLLRRAEHLLEVHGRDVVRGGLGAGSGPARPAGTDQARGGGNPLPDLRPVRAQPGRDRAHPVLHPGRAARPVPVDAGLGPRGGDRLR